MNGRTLVAAAALVALAAPARAQRVPNDSGAAWLDRVALTLRYGALVPAGHSELFSLMDRALDPGSRALQPRLAGGELHVRAAGAFGVVLGAASGGGTVASVSRAQPLSGGAGTSQQTRLDLTTVGYVGAELTALRWHGARLAFDAGGGVAHYTLRQWGDFVDADRQVGFAQDFRSAGSGAFGYAGAGVEVPVRRWVALRGDVRRQVGSAPMSGDFAAFDRLDLGGTTFGAGLTLRRGR